jgi:hypothetical protein
METDICQDLMPLKEVVRCIKRNVLLMMSANAKTLIQVLTAKRQEEYAFQETRWQLKLIFLILYIETGRNISQILLVRKTSINSLAIQGPPFEKILKYIREYDMMFYVH